MVLTAIPLIQEPLSQRRNIPREVDVVVDEALVEEVLVVVEAVLVVVVEEEQQGLQDQPVKAMLKRRIGTVTRARRHQQIARQRRNLQRTL
jgi:hypothetical protein